MSYRDLRNFTEMMRALGFTRLISMENFRNPNFPLVAEILLWLVKRYDPNVDLPSDIDTEQDRVIFIRSVAQFMATKAHIKLNTKKLYQADGYAVKEILKITSVMYNAMKMDPQLEEENELSSSTLPVNTSNMPKLADIKVTRQLASEITGKGATLYDLLGKEIELREIRSGVLGKQLEIMEVEKGMKAAVKAVEEENKKTTQQIENVASDEANLETKIEKKKIELERNQKRLQTLKKVRPAFMDEYEKLEEELKKHYTLYLVKFRCLTYLEQQLDEYDKIEQEKMEERQISMRKMVDQMKQQDLLQSEGGVDLEGINDVENGTSGKNSELGRRPQNGAGMRSVLNGKEVVPPKASFGSMTGGNEEDSDDSLGSDTDLDLEDADGEDVSEFGSDEDLEVSDVKTKKPHPRPIETPESDNDF